MGLWHPCILLLVEIQLLYIEQTEQILREVADMIILKILATLCGGANPDRCYRVVSLLRGFYAVSYRLRGTDLVVPCPVHRRPAAGWRGIPWTGLSRFNLWHPGHR